MQLGLQLALATRTTGAVILHFATLVHVHSTSSACSTSTCTVLGLRLLRRFKKVLVQKPITCEIPRQIALS